MSTVLRGAKRSTLNAQRPTLKGRDSDYTLRLLLLLLLIENATGITGASSPSLSRSYFTW
jgi:hypothetical protein